MKPPESNFTPPSLRHPVAIWLCLLVSPLLLLVTGCASYPSIGPDWKWQQLDPSAQRPLPRKFLPPANPLIASVNSSAALPSPLRPAE